ncbi:MAG: restriction endonuclease subunit S [Duncaniella sp.]|nr:restriction endonuclease subunit S [Duncaniella sp.]
MSKLKELIDRLCLNGVVYKPLGKIASIPTERVNIKHLPNNLYIGVENLIKDKGGMIPAAELPVVNDVIKFKTDDILIGNIRPYLKKIWLADKDGGTNGDVVLLRINNDIPITPKFLYYIVSSDSFFFFHNQYAKGAKMPRGDKMKIMTFPIPVPPLEVQEEVVKILDRFSNYAAELQAELQARKEQYEYYRNLLLTFNPSACGCGTDDEQEIKNVTIWGGHNYEITWKTMGEIANFKYGFTAKGCENGNARYIRITDISELGSLLPSDKKYIILDEESVDYLLNKNDIVMARTGATFGKTLIYEDDSPAVYASFLIKITFNDSNILNRYYWHYSKSKHYWRQANQLVSKGGQPQFNANSLSQVIIPIPPLELQEKIVAILDRFETLVNDLTQGLPAEIAAVKEQYEYYRNKLLTFKQLA